MDEASPIDEQELEEIAILAMLDRRPTWEMKVAYLTNVLIERDKTKRLKRMASINRERRRW